MRKAGLSPPFKFAFTRDFVCGGRYRLAAGRLLRMRKRPSAHFTLLRLPAEDFPVRRSCSMS